MKSYLITSPEHYTQEAESFAQKLQKSFAKYKPDWALYRDKQNKDYKSLAKVFIKLCKENHVEAHLHGDCLLAEELGADGVHLTSTQYETLTKAKETKLRVGISAHTQEEVLLAQKLGADYVTFSPIFTSPGKGMPKGTLALMSLLEDAEIDVIALGGIVDKTQIAEIAQTKAAGFASIRYFYA